MASINQIVSAIAHSVQGADSVPVRRAIKLGVIRARNEIIRHSYEQHGYVDKVLKQRIRYSLVDVPDGDINGTYNLNLYKIKRTKQKVHKPTRLTNNLPFSSVRTAGVENPLNIPFVTEPVSKYYAQLPGMCPNVTYDYINGFIYINAIKNTEYSNLGSVIVEAVFERPELIPIEYYDFSTTTPTEINTELLDDDESVITEDMVGTIHKLVLESFNPNVVRKTNEIPEQNLVK